MWMQSDEIAERLPGDLMSQYDAAGTPYQRPTFLRPARQKARFDSDCVFADTCPAASNRSVARSSSCISFSLFSAAGAILRWFVSPR